MKRVLAAVASCAVLLCGCQNANNRAVEGAAVGGVVGAGAGAIIGHQSGHGGQGALLGGALGALTGALVGSNIQKQPQTQQTQAVQPQPALQQMTVNEIVTLTAQGVSDDAIIDRIRATNSRFVLISSDIELLKSKGVSQRVIDAMQGK